MEIKKEDKKKEALEKCRCSNCGSLMTYSLVDGTLVCRKCSFKEKRQVNF
jgi:transposase